MYPIRFTFEKVLGPLFIGLTVIIYFHWRYVNTPSDNGCKWPPSRPTTVSPDTPFDLTLCVRPFTHLANQSEPSYYLSQLFRLNKPVTFDDLVNVTTDLWDLARYPEVFRTYPQNVPLKGLIQRIKTGKRVAHVSYPILNPNLSQIDQTYLCLLCILDMMDLNHT